MLQTLCLLSRPLFHCLICATGMKPYINQPIDMKKYGGKQVAIVDGNIVASGRTLQEVLRKARKLFPSKPLDEIAVFAVPKMLNVIYY
jgi:hypoxanthine phosphoribosyltransferase